MYVGELGCPDSMLSGIPNNLVMAVEDVRGKYAQILIAFCRNAEDKYLRQAPELGINFAAQGVSPGDISALHQQAVLETGVDRPDKRERAAAFLAEVLMGYGIATHEQIYKTSQEESEWRRHTEILESMQRIAEIMAGRDSFVAKCNAVLRTLFDVIPADLFTLRRFDETGNSLILVAHTSLLGFPYEPPKVVTNPSLISFRFYRDKNLNVINDYAAQPDAYLPFLEMGVQSCAFLPVGSQGDFFGLIYIISKEINHFTPERIQLLSTIRDSLSVLFENADLYEKINQELTQRRTAQTALAESEARFRTLAENTADIVWEMDPEGIYTYCSPNVELITGYGSQELAGSSQYNFMPPDETNRVSAMFSGLASEGKDISLMEYVFIFRDGRQATMERNGAAVFNENGELTGYRGVDRDITARKLADEHLRETARLASIGVLAAGVAHEINNPLTSVMLYTEQALSEEMPDHIRESIQTVNQQAHRMGRVVKNLLDFARHSEPERREISIVTMLRRTLELKAYDFTMNHITVIDDGVPAATSDSGYAMLDENQMVQVILNLLNNAEQAGMSAQPTPEIRVSVLLAGGWVTISVEDNGPGIAEEDLPKIFDPFFTTKDIGQGTGLGLSVSQGIVALHGGEIWAENIRGGGAVFYVKLPTISR